MYANVVSTNLRSSNWGGKSFTLYFIFDACWFDGKIYHDLENTTQIAGIKLEKLLNALNFILFDSLSPLYYISLCFSIYILLLHICDCALMPFCTICPSLSSEQFSPTNEQELNEIILSKVFFHVNIILPFQPFCIWLRITFVTTVLFKDSIYFRKNTGCMGRKSGKKSTLKIAAFCMVQFFLFANKVIIPNTYIRCIISRLSKCQCNPAPSLQTAMVFLKIF